MSFGNLWLRMVRLCSFVMHAHNTFFLSCSLLLYIYTSLIMPHKKADKENSNPSSPHAIWNMTCDNILVDCLVAQRKTARYPAMAPGVTVSGRHVLRPSRISMHAQVAHKRQEEAFGRQSTAFQTVCRSNLDDLLFTKVFNLNKYIQRVSIPFNNSSTHICPVSAEACIGFLLRCGEASVRIVVMPEITAATHAAFLCFSSRIWSEEARDLEEEDVG